MYKQVIIVRKDLRWDRGKICVHAAHAAIGALGLADEKTIKKWEKEGAKKVVLRVKNLKELEEIERKIRKKKIPYFLVKDAGKTQLKPGTVTSLGVGPVEEDKIDKITGKLKLL